MGSPTASVSTRSRTRSRVSSCLLKVVLPSPAPHCGSKAQTGQVVNTTLSKGGLSPKRAVDRTGLPGQQPISSLQAGFPRARSRFTITRLGPEPLLPPELAGRAFTIAEARRHGLTADHLRSAHWRRLARGVYAARHAADN